MHTNANNNTTHTSSGRFCTFLQKAALAIIVTTIVGCGGGGGGGDTGSGGDTGDGTTTPAALVVSVEKVSITGRAVWPNATTLAVRIDGADVAVDAQGIWKTDVLIDNEGPKVLDLEVLVDDVIVANRELTVSEKAIAGKDTSKGERITITVTDENIVEKVQAFGINLSGQAYYNAATLKRKAAVNFEGSVFKQALFGPDAQSDTYAYAWSAGVSKLFKAESTTYTIISGPEKGKQGKPQAISEKIIQHKGSDRTVTEITWDQPIENIGHGGGYILEADHTHLGAIPIREPKKELDYWGTANLKIEQGDVPPESFGKSALVLDATNGKSYIRFTGQKTEASDLTGKWTCSFWAKTKSAQGELEAKPDLSQTSISPQYETVQLTQAWKKYSFDFLISEVSQKSKSLTFLLSALSGEVLIDDVEFWQEGKDLSNKTVFDDGLVKALRELNPSIIRKLQMGGSTMENALQATPLQMNSFASSIAFKSSPWGKKSTSFTMHEFFVLCQEIGADPWYSIPGILHEEELAIFVEYLAAPATVGYGKKRAEMGQVEPWTEVFDNIHIEYGNEAWNTAPAFQSGGFNGSDYWEGLTKAIKDSPYYSTKMLIHIGAQASYVSRTSGIAERTPNADRLSIAPYTGQSITEDLVELIPTNADKFKWLFASPIQRAMTGAMADNYKTSLRQNMELSFYEINHHIVKGDVSAHYINPLVNSIGGGINIANTMLLELKEHRVREQCFFNLIQKGYTADGLKGETTLDKTVHLWGCYLGNERVRPTYLALKMANQALAGTLVKTIHSKNEPTFKGALQQGKGKPIIESDSHPVLWSYSFKNGSEYTTIIINLDTAHAHHITLSRADKKTPSSVKGWTMTADSIVANNESEEAEVRISDVENASQVISEGIEIKAHSMYLFSYTL